MAKRIWWFAGGGIYLFPGNGDGTFQAPVQLTLSANNNYTYLAAADFFTMVIRTCWLSATVRSAFSWATTMGAFNRQSTSP